MNPITGQTLVFRRTSVDTAGALVEVESVYEPGSAEPLEHYHPRQQERFEVLEGALKVRLSGDERDLRAGDTLIVEPGTVHAMWNPGSERARMVWQTRPALKTETFFETVWGLAANGKVGANGAPGILQSAVLMREYSDEFRLAEPPAPVQRLAFAILSPLGRLLGRRGRYERYSGAE